MPIESGFIAVDGVHTKTVLGFVVMGTNLRCLLPVDNKLPPYLLVLATSAYQKKRLLLWSMVAVSFFFHVAFIVLAMRPVMTAGSEIPQRWFSFLPCRLCSG